MLVKSSPAISVLLPIFNAENYLALAIESLQNQSFSDFEILAINDGSTDLSLTILEGFAKSDKRIRVIDQENKGLIATLNEGIQKANAPLIARMDADDICHVLRFEKQLAYLEEHPECVAVGSRVMLIDPEGLPICEFSKQVEHNDIDSDHLSGRGGAIAHPAVMLRKSALEKIGGYRDDVIHAEDIDLFLRLAEVGKLANLPEIFLYYRQHALSIGYRFRQEQKASAEKAILDACHRRNIDTSNHVMRNEEEAAVVIANTHIKWAWWSLQSGHVKTARKHALKAIISKPCDFHVWKLLACSIRGY